VHEEPQRRLLTAAILPRRRVAPAPSIKEAQMVFNQLTGLMAVSGLLCLSAAGLSAQETGAIRGTAMDAETQEPLRGAQVQVVGTRVGGITNASGAFLLLNVPAGDRTVRITSIGYRTVEEAVTVTAGATATVEISLAPAAIGLDEIVVTGTAGQARRREIGNSVVQINAEEIEMQPINDVSDVLMGNATGVTVLQNSGQVGVGSSIRLRGNNSVSQGNNPLIYVDGVRIHESGFAYSDEGGQALGALSDINPNDIERIEVVKGPAATTLYGTEAAGGVIQIFTKRGSGSTAAWSFQIEQGIHNMGWVGPDKDVNPTGLGVNVCNDGTLDPNFPTDPTCPASGSWLKNGRIQRYNLSVRGGTDLLDYFVSTSWGDERGVIDVGSDEYDDPGISDWSIRGNFGFAPRNDLSIRFNNYYSRRDMTWIPDGNNAEGFLLNVMRGDNDYAPDHQDGLVFGMKLDQAVDHAVTGVGISWTPGAVTHRLNAGMDFTRSNYVEEHPWSFFRVPLGDREVDDDHRRKLTLDYAGAWGSELVGFSSQLSWGAQFYQDFRLRVNGFGNDFAGPGDKELDSAARTSVSETRRNIANGGFFVQEMLGWNDQLFVTLGLRVDGHSSFGEEFGWAPYPKISAAYTLSDNAFYPDSWGSLKLRTAYGESGKAPGVFDATQTWESIAGDEGQPGVAPANLGNPELGPERTKEVELGFEGSSFDGRLWFDYSYYNQTTSDALIGVQQVPSSGFTGRQLENVGEIRNWGHEASVNVTPLRRENLTWDVGLRYSTNESEVISLGDLENIYLGWRNYAWVGEPLPSYCHDVVQNPDEVGATPVFETECQGTTYPTWTMGINTGVEIGNRLTLDVLGESQGGHVLNAATAYQNVRRGVWPPCYDIQAKVDAGETADLTAYDRAKCDPAFVRYGMWTEAADFFKLRSMSLGYRFPDSWVPSQLAGATLRIQGRNLLTITDFPDLDPEVSEDGINSLYRQGYYHLPPFRTFMVSLKVDF
jgi:TonB-dependent SusC/RagA subfamily outer membrane receptor